jgi:hypothetical protein
MGKGILNRGTKVHQSKTKQFKWEEEIHDDEEEFKIHQTIQKRTHTE